MCYGGYMKVLYDFDKYKLINVPNNSDSIPVLPFRFNYMMFNNLINLEKDLTDSELYDKCILEEQLWTRMCSQVLRDYMSRRYYNE